MRIHALTLHNVRAVEHLELKELPDSGVVVIHGDNEQGKSTIMDALNAVLNIKHSSNAKDIRALSPVHRDEGPSVTAHLTVGPVEFTVTKRWLRKKGAELTVHSPVASSHTGGDAEDKLEEIKNAHLDSTLLETLFLRQDDLGDAVKAAGIPSLEQALNAGSDGEVIDTNDDDALMAAVEREYQRFYTPKGGENKAFDNARKDREKAAAALDKAEENVRALATRVDQFERHESAKAADEKDLPAAREDLEKARAELSTAQQVAVTAASAQEAHDRAAAELTGAEKAVAERAELEKELSGAKDLVAEHEKALQAAKEKAQAEATRIASLTEALQAAKDRHDKAGEAAKKARATAQLVADAAALADLQRLTGQLDELEENIASVRTELAGLTVTDADVDAAVDASRALDVARGIRDLAVSRLELTATEDTQITVDDDPLTVSGEPARVELRDGRTVTIGTVTATYRAGHAGEADPDVEVRAAETALDELLAEAGCENLAELKKARDEASEARAALTSLTTRRADMLGDRDAEDVRARATHLAGRLADAELPDITLDEARTDVEKAEEEVDAAAAAARSAEAALEPWSAGEADRVLVRATADFDNAHARRQEIAEKLYKQQDRASDEELRTTVDVARATLAEATEARDAAQKELTEADPEGKQAAAEAAAARVDSLESRIHNAELELAGLRSYIDQAAGAAEEREIAASEDEASRRQLANLERQAHAAARLREVLRRHREQARARYAQPFVDELTRLSRTVFDQGVRYELDKDLRVEARTIDGATVPLAALSGGAKEQLAILTRFAIASLVAKEGGADSTDGYSPVPVIIDDALGSTDPQRLQRMGQLFTRIGTHAQVIVLTCFPQRYDWVQPKQVHAITQLKQQ